MRDIKKLYTAMCLEYWQADDMICPFCEKQMQFFETELCHYFPANALKRELTARYYDEIIADLPLINTVHACHDCNSVTYKSVRGADGRGLLQRISSGQIYAAKKCVNMLLDIGLTGFAETIANIRDVDDVNTARKCFSNWVNEILDTRATRR